MNSNHPLLQSCTILPGIGSQIFQKLNHLGVFSIYDLLLHLPFRYQDKTRITAIADLKMNSHAVIQGVIRESYWLKTRRPIYHCTVKDDTGEINFRFFNMPGFQQKRLQRFSIVKAFGEVKLKPYGFEMVHPEIEFINQTESTPVQDFFTPWYPSTQGIHQSQWRKYIQHTFKAYQDILDNLEWLDEHILNTHQLPSLTEALKKLHFPEPSQSCEQLIDIDHPARQRLALEELIAYSLSSFLLKKNNQKALSHAYPAVEALEQQLKASLPFQLTDAQIKVFHEIQADMNQAHPMLRLLQGDVGSGKTIVCALSALAVLKQGHQVALMAPTDLLSEQHYQNISKWLSPLGFQVIRLNRTTPSKEKKQNLLDLASGKAQFVIGTHALFQDKVQFKKLGLVIIDEQHRFGVIQRMKLAEKTQDDFHPHQLFVTATPIPRTLAMTQFSHFDLSILDQLPKGRKPIHTAVMSQDKRDDIIVRLKNTIEKKGQIYWVCTRIEEDEEGEQQATEEIFHYLQNELPFAKIAMVHGQLKAQDKDKIMVDFKQGLYDVLVATTVIEVGVDVPNANIMIIENAERLGLSQLHQLRGRVGRGQAESFCILMYNQPLSNNGQQRLQIIRQSTDGFWLAEEDMKLRGYGDVFGTQQSGMTEFKIARLPEHFNLLKLAQNIAHELIEKQSPWIEYIIQHWYQNSEKYLKA
ncbi:MAG TPA: ATP-dependent DNA helicase RecG [Legionellales bacterium]|nr:ATP-dependent DNA helicase RecG [Legionellales bacterium]